MKSVLKPLAESVLFPLELTAASSADPAIQKKNFGSETTALIISNEEMNDIMKTTKSFEQSVLLTNGVSKTIKNEAKEKRGGFIGTLLVIIGASLLGNLLGGKRVKKTGHGTIKGGEGTIRAGQDL